MSDVNETFSETLIRWQQEHQKRTETLKADSLKALRELGATHVSVSYSGYGDSGQIEDVVVHKDDELVTIPDDIFHRLSEAAWAIIALDHSGFENNEGGGGEITWDVTAGKIHLSHYDNYVTTEESEHEY